MVHGLAIRRGCVSLLCNGSPVVSRKGYRANDYKGSTLDLVSAVSGTMNSTRRILIPQESLEHEVTCCKCKPMMDDKTRAKHMKGIYKHSIKYKTRKNPAPACCRMEKLECNKKNKSQTVEIPQGKTCVLTISVL